MSEGAAWQEKKKKSQCLLSLFLSAFSSYLMFSKCWIWGNQGGFFPPFHLPRGKQSQSNLTQRSYLEGEEVFHLWLHIVPVISWHFSGHFSSKHSSFVFFFVTRIIIPGRHWRLPSIRCKVFAPSLPDVCYRCLSWNGIKVPVCEFWCRKSRKWRIFYFFLPNTFQRLFL